MNPTKNPPSRITPSRVLIKISGAGFGGSLPLEPDAIKYVVEQVEQAREKGVQIALVVGGGNILRGKEQEMLDRTAGDLAGMVATIVNGIVLRDQLQKLGIPVLLQSALPIARITDPINPDEAISHLQEDGVVIFAGGTGNPYFTTDSAAALRAGEVKADLILKGTDVSGVYTGDPSREEADFIPTLTYKELTKDELGIIDLTCARICRETRIPMVIYDLFSEGLTARILDGEEIGTYIYPDPSSS